MSARDHGDAGWCGSHATYPYLTGLALICQQTICGCRPQTTGTPYRAGHEPVCCVLGWKPSTACALLKFAEAPTHTLRFSYPVDIDIPTSVSAALEIAAWCLSSWPAAIFTYFT